MVVITNSAPVPCARPRRFGPASPRLAPIVELLDGTIELPPDPKTVRQVRLVTGASLAFAAVSCLGVGGVLAYSMARIPWPVRLAGLAALLVFFGVSEFVLWIAVTPPVLRADAVQVSSSSRLDRQRMQRSDLEFIFRGQVAGRGRTRGVWYKSYIFAAADGKIGMTFGALMFTPDGMAGFAQHLQVPIRGDFSVRVKDRVDPATA